MITQQKQCKISSRAIKPNTLYTLPLNGCTLPLIKASPTRQVASLSL
jgi:hypothetical protein